MKKTLNFFLVIMMIVLSSCTGGSQAEAKINSHDNQVQVLYLHGTQRCRTCVAVGKFSQELVAEMNDKNVVWKEIDLSTPQGEKIGDKYEIIGSGLLIVKGNKWEDLTDMAFRYALSDTPKFKNELKTKILKLAK